MLLVSRVPKPPLDRFIASIWYCENDPRPLALERVLPSGSAQLIVNLKEDETRIYDPDAGGMRRLTLPGAVLSGVTSRYALIDTAEQECAAGVVFRPGGMGAFFPAPAYEMTNAVTPLELFWGRTRSAELRNRLLEAETGEARLIVLEQAVLEQATTTAFRSTVVHPAVGFALRLFEQRPETVAIATVADGAGLSAKRFIEIFRRSVGLRPKQYCRILRFQRALARAEQGRRVDWTRIAADCGYFDQSHFIHDFRSFAGITPTAYDGDRTPFRNHVKFLQAGADAVGR